MNIVIVGLGITGLAVANYFARQGISFSVIDTRDNPPKLEALRKKHPNIPVYLGGFPKSVLAKAEQIILSPGIPKDHPDILGAISKNTEIISEIELFARKVPQSAKIVAITGSNGKSTVTTLVGEMAKKASLKVGVGGNLGTSALELLSENPDMYVLELSSFQLETTDSLKPHVAAVLNISADHLDRYASLAEYHAAKQRIYKNAEFAIINNEDPLSGIGIDSKSKIIRFGLEVPQKNEYGLIEIEKEVWLTKGDNRLLPMSSLQLFGKHNVSNVLAALALGEAVDLPMDVMLDTIKTFKGLEHRCEWVRTVNTVPWINDSKGTNVGATLSALKGLASSITGKWILIAGGVGKNADFSPLKKGIQENCRAVVLIGEAQQELYELLNPVTPCFRASTMNEAVQLSYNQAKPGDGVLLSPACASFDMFENFEHRGKEFKKSVLVL